LFFKKFILTTLLIAIQFSIFATVESITDSLMNVAEQSYGLPKIKAYFDLSYIYQFNDINIAIEYDELALEEAVKIEDSLWIARIYLDLGYIKKYEGDYETALKYILLGKKISESAKIKEIQAIAYHEIE
jgi:hypothetical protein